MTAPDFTASPADDQLSLEQYERDLRRHATTTGFRAARIGDPDSFDASVDAIKTLAEDGGPFTSDDVRPSVIVGSNSIGAAFRALSTAGVIEAVGYRTSRIPSRHGALVRVWRKGSP